MALSSIFSHYIVFTRIHTGTTSFYQWKFQFLFFPTLYHEYNPSAIMLPEAGQHFNGSADFYLGVIAGGIPISSCMGATRVEAIAHPIGDNDPGCVGKIDPEPAYRSLQFPLITYRA
jgi:hypothetical protein